MRILQHSASKHPNSVFDVFPTEALNHNGRVRGRGGTNMAWSVSIYKMAASRSILSWCKKVMALYRRTYLGKNTQTVRSWPIF